MPECVGERDPDLEHLLVARAHRRRSAGRGSHREPARRSGRRCPPRRTPRTERRSRGARAGRRRAPRGWRARGLRPRGGGSLDRHLAVEQLVVGAPHDAEAAGAEALEQPVAAEYRRAPPNRRPRVTGSWLRAGARGRYQGLVRVHRLLRSPIRGCSLPQAGRRSVGEREVADGTNRERGGRRGGHTGAFLNVSSPQGAQGASQLVVFRR